MSKQPLTYNRQIPAFLQQMQNAQASQYDQPNPQLAQNRRHGKPRSKSEDAEDAPLVLDVDGNVVEGACVDVHGEVSLEGEHNTTTTTSTTDNVAGGKKDGRWGDVGRDQDGSDSKPIPVAATAAIGNTRKRKVGRVIGGSEEDDNKTTNDLLVDDPLAKAIKSQGGSTGIILIAGEEAQLKQPGKEGDKKKKKKRSKKIKLSFDNDED